MYLSFFYRKWQIFKLQQLKLSRTSNKRVSASNIYITFSLHKYRQINELVKVRQCLRLKAC